MTISKDELQAYLDKTFDLQSNEVQLKPIRVTGLTDFDISFVMLEGENGNPEPKEYTVERVSLLSPTPEVGYEGELRLTLVAAERAGLFDA